MSTNDDLRSGEPQSMTNEPEENLAETAFDPSFSSLEFDREHGDEVEGARRYLDAEYVITIRHAA